MCILTFRMHIILAVPSEWKVVIKVSLKQNDNGEGTWFMASQVPHHANRLISTSRRFTGLSSSCNSYICFIIVLRRIQDCHIFPPFVLLWDLYSHCFLLKETELQKQCTTNFIEENYRRIYISEYPYSKYGLTTLTDSANSSVQPCNSILY